MIDRYTADWPAAAHAPSRKETPTLGEELREALRFLFRPPERRLRGTDFVWSYDELADDIPD